MVVLTGLGYDIHRLEEGLPLIVGGVELHESVRGAVAHSDGDVLLHALCDALLGAVGAEDIGYHFPDTDPAFAGADSLKLLGDVAGIVSAKNARILNVDCTVILERPRLAPHRQKIRENIAGVLDLPIERVSVKATTNERLDAVGQSEGIAAMAIATVRMADQAEDL